MSEEYMLTTKDNPFNYYTQYDQWYSWDTANGHHTLAYLDRVTKTSTDLPTEVQEADITSAIDEILRETSLDIYTKSVRPKESSDSSSTPD